MTALDVLVEEGLAERATRLGEQFRNEIRALRSPLVKEVRGRGLFNAIVIDESASSRARTAWQFCLLLKSRGVLAKPTHVNMYVCVHDLYPEYANDDKTVFLKSIRFSPPLVISEEDLEKSIGVIRQALIDLDTVRLSSPFCFALYTSSFLFVWQLEEIPGEVESERGFRDEISN